MQLDSRADLGIFQLNTRIRELLSTAWPYPVWIRGEISGRPRLHPRGHVYFQLVERSPADETVIASIDCALFASARNGVVRDFAREGLSFDLQDGSPLRVLGRVDIWPPSGRFQFVVESIDPHSADAGATVILRRLVEKLRQAGVLELNSKRSLSQLPLRVGLVTASGSAALEDFLTTLRESGFPFEVWIAPAPMQGAGTPEGVIASLRALSRVEGLDVVVLTRGGGSATDLAWFNSEALALAISRAPWPVVSGIGHETDFTLPDFVCSTRAKTPTHAAQLLVDRVSDSASDLAALSRMLAVTAIPRLRGEKRRLDAAAAMLQSGLRTASSGRRAEIGRLSTWMLAAIERRIPALRSSLDSHAAQLKPERCLRTAEITAGALGRLTGLLRPSVARVTGQADGRLRLAESLVAARDPSRMLALGWSIVTTEDGRVLRKVDDTSPGRALNIRVSDGSVLARTEETQR